MAGRSALDRYRRHVQDTITSLLSLPPDPDSISPSSLAAEHFDTLAGFVRSDLPISLNVANKPPAPNTTGETPNLRMFLRVLLGTICYKAVRDTRNMTHKLLVDFLKYFWILLRKKKWICNGLTMDDENQDMGIEALLQLLNILSASGAAIQIQAGRTGTEIEPLRAFHDINMQFIKPKHVYPKYASWVNIIIDHFIALLYKELQFSCLHEVLVVTFTDMWSIPRLESSERPRYMYLKRDETVIIGFCEIIEIAGKELYLSKLSKIWNDSPLADIRTARSTIQSYLKLKLGIHYSQEDGRYFMWLWSDWKERLELVSKDILFPEMTRSMAGKAVENMTEIAERYGRRN